MQIYDKVGYAIQHIDTPTVVRHYFPDFRDSSTNVRCAFPENHNNQDLTPSLSIDPEKGVGICFRCRLSFQHVVDLIAKMENHEHELPEKKKYDMWMAAVDMWYPKSVSVLSEDMVEPQKRALWANADVSMAAMEYLKGDKRGLTSEIIDEFELGLDSRGLITIPIRDVFGNLVNVYYFGWLPSHTNRVSCVKGHGECRPYPENHWPDKNILLVEGFWDTLKGRVHKLPTATWSGGAGSSNVDKYSMLFRDRKVYVYYDNDEAGQTQAPLRANEFAEYGINSQVLPPPTEQGLVGKDLTDWLQDGPTLAQVLTRVVESNDGSSPIHLQKVTLADVYDCYNELLYISDKLYIPTILGAAIANNLPDDPIWLLIIGPPGTGKSEMVMSLSEWDKSFILPDLSRAALVSGYMYNKKDDDASLLPELNNKVMLLSEYGAIMSMHPTSREELMTQLRQVYDGRLSKRFGTKELYKWKGKVGFIGGSVPTVESHQHTQAILGDRFIYFRIDEDLYAISDHSIEITGKKKKLREILRKTVAAYLNQFNGTVDMIPITTEFKRHILSVASIAARGRTGIQWSRSGGRIEDMPSTEAPTRLSKAFLLVAQGVAHVHGHKEMTDLEYKVAARLASDTIPTRRRALLRYLMDGEPHTRREISDKFHSNLRTVAKWLDDLWALRLIDRIVDDDWTYSSQVEVNDAGRKYYWKIAKSVKESFDGIFPSPPEPSKF